MNEALRGAPVYLHCGWRTAGTWIWSRFRARPEVMGFYEPLHEALGELTLQTMPLMRPSATDSRHPDPERPYFQDFTPLLSPRDRGVVGYRAGFAYDDFLAEPEADLSQLAAYLESLTALARSKDKIAVFKHCRTTGRLAWVRRNFPTAVHLAVMRSPLAQWRSGWRLFVQERNAYFISIPLMILTRYREHPRFAATLRAMDVSSALLSSLANHRKWASSPVIQSALYRAFLAYWVGTAYSTMIHADDAVDSDRLTESAAYRDAIERMIFARTGLLIDFSEARSMPTLRWPSELGDAEIRICHEAALAVLPAVAALERGGSRTRHEAAYEFIHEKLVPKRSISAGPVIYSDRPRITVGDENKRASGSVSIPHQ